MGNVEMGDAMPTMNTVWDRTAEFLSDNLAALTPLALFALFVPLSLSGTLNPLVGTLGGAGDVALGAALVLLALVNMWGNIAITGLALDPAGGRGAAVAAATASLLRVIAAAVLLLLGMIALLLPFGVALGLSGIDMAALAAGQSSDVTPAFGPAVFIIVYLPVVAVLVLWVSARLVVLVPTIVAQRIGLGAIVRSFAMTRPVQWKIVGVLILYLVTAFVATAAARTVVGGVLGLLIGGDGPITLAGVLTATVVAGVSTILSLLSIAFAAQLYLALRGAA